jgi:hypothetical protein
MFGNQDFSLKSYGHMNVYPSPCGDVLEYGLLE